MSIKKVLIMSFLGVLINSCTKATEKLDLATKAENEMNQESNIKQHNPKIITIRGTIRYKNFEGGFWGLEATNGNKYLPSGLDEQYLIDGLVLEVTGVIKEDKNLMTTKQYGLPFFVQTSKVISNDNVKFKNAY